MVRRRRPQLLTMADYKTANFIAKALHRSENAVRYRLAVLGKSSRFHLEGYARRTLAQELHLGSRTIQRLIAEGLLEVRDPRIARKSLEEACARRQLPTSLHDLQPETKGTGMLPYRIWADVARQLNVDASVIEQLIFCGVLKLYDPRVTEKSLTRFCSRYGALIKTDFLDAETRDWLAASMDLAPAAGKVAAQGMEAFRKHALVVRTCEHCGRAIRALLVSVPAPESQTPCKRRERMAGATELECGASVTGQGSNQLNYVPNRGINNLA